MAVGLTLGRFVPGLDDALDAVKVGGISVPIALGLLIMMYPVLAKVRYDETRRIGTDRTLLVTSLVLNWIIGPAFMFALAWIFLADLPEYRTGLIIVGLARCIAMVLIWNDLACGDREAAAVLVAINSVFQVLAFGALGWFYLQILPSWLGLETTSAEFSVGAIVISVLVFLGIPLVAGFLTRFLGEKARGRQWYEERFLPRLSPFALYGLLFTIVLLFALQGDAITSNPLDVSRIAVPLLVYFVVMFFGALLLSRAVGLNYALLRSRSLPRVTTLSSPSPWPSAPSASPPGRPWPASSAPLSRSPYWWHWSTLQKPWGTGCSQATRPSRTADVPGSWRAWTDATGDPPGPLTSPELETPVFQLRSLFPPPVSVPATGPPALRHDRSTP